MYPGFDCPLNTYLNFFFPDKLSRLRTKNVNYLHLQCQVLEVS